MLLVIVLVAGDGGADGAGYEGGQRGGHPHHVHDVRSAGRQLGVYDTGEGKHR